MRVLNSIEQFKKRNEEIHGLYLYMNLMASELQREIRIMEERWFVDKSKVRLKKFEAEQIQKVANSLGEYSTYLFNQANPVEVKP